MDAPLSIPANRAALTRKDYEVASRIEQSETFKDYREAFETATGLPLVFRRLGSFSAPMTGSRHLNPFCALLRGKAHACAGCHEMQSRLESGPWDSPRTVSCFAGLIESTIPIRVGEAVIGYLQTGQIRFERPNARDVATLVTTLSKSSASHFRSELIGAFLATRVLTRARYNAVLRLLASFASHLSALSNEMMVAERTAEPMAVTRARRFIQDHLVEELSLPQVAKAGGTSPFYFCKLFKGATGLTFTDYVARTRVEAAKKALLHSQTRIGEAAFAAGFQSLSQFNRVFRRVTGVSPTRYRQRIHGTNARLSAAA